MKIIYSTGAVGPAGKSTYEIWLELPGNAGKTEQDFIRYVLDEIDDSHILFQDLPILT